VECTVHRRPSGILVCALERAVAEFIFNAFPCENLKWNDLACLFYIDLTPFSSPKPIEVYS
jgi:hypothetical protein